MNRSNTICLFDVDGTLTVPRQKITTEMRSVLEKLREQVSVGLVGGSDLGKIHEQMSVDDAEPLQRTLESYDYVFAENGLHAFANGQAVGNESIVGFLGERKIQELINFCLEYMSKLELPCKRGTFVEFRNGMLNISPPGRSVTQAQRIEFFEFDKRERVREKFVAALCARFPPEFGLQFSIGGQISIDIFPIGWDKTYCLRYLPDTLKNVYFFGDKTEPDGNDYQIYAHSRTIGQRVESPADTKLLLEKLFHIS